MTSHYERPNHPDRKERGKYIIPQPLSVCNTERKIYMNILKAYSLNGKKVVDSREVAEMVERDHKELMKTIRTYIGYLDEGEIPPIEFFIESTYTDSIGRTKPCFLITKKGCDMIANKLTGKKGVQFTAAYVTAFEDMKQKIVATRIAPSVSPGGVAQLINVTRRIMLDSGDTPEAVRQMEREMLETWCVPVPEPLQHPAQLNLFSPDYQAISGGEQA